MSKINLEQLKQLKDEGRDVKELAQTFGVSLTAIYRALPKIDRLVIPESIERLTGKQRKFIQLKSTGISGTEAALRAYDCQDRKSAKEVASQLMTQPEIKAAMSDWLQWCGCGRDRRAARLSEFVNNSDPGIALPALREAFKLGDDYPKDNQESADITIRCYFPERVTPEQATEIYGEGVIDVGPDEAGAKEPKLLPYSDSESEY